MPEPARPMNVDSAPRAPNARERPRPSRRGRPLDAAKHARILEVATRAFLERGFRSTSMDLVARHAGVSKITIYSHFKSKESLFGAIITGLAQRLLPTISRFGLGDMPVEQALRRFGRMYLDLALAPSSIALHRLVVAESARSPALGRLIFQSGPALVIAALADYLARQETARIAYPRLAAEQFLGMVLGHAQLGLLLHARPAGRTRGEIDRIVDHAVRTFLDGVFDPPGRPERHRA